MYQYHCLNPISMVGLENFSANYVRAGSLRDVDAVLVRSADMHDLELPDSVVAVARAGAGTNNIPLQNYAEKGIVVFNTPGANANGVKELVFAGMLLAARDINGGIEWVKTQTGNPDIASAAEKEKKRFAGHELSGKKLGVIGLGAIGVLVANAATHLGMEVLGYDPYISVDAAWSLSRSITHINDISVIFRECDYITIHVPLTDSTKGMIGKRELDLMKPEAVLLNFARDLLVDEAAVIQSLDNGRLHRYVSDFPNPTVAGHPGVILSPHIGASTSESEDNCAKAAVKELRDFLENGNILNSVNYPTCQMGICDTAARLSICHRNRKKMISQFTDALADTNIAHMNNSSRGDYAYTLIDLEDRPTDEVLGRLGRIEGVLKFRVI